MSKFLNLLLYRHRRFKGQTYLRHRFPWMFVISCLFSFFLTDSYLEFFTLIVFFMLIDILLAIAAWFYYDKEL